MARKKTKQSICEGLSNDEVRQLVHEQVSLAYLTPSEAASTAINCIYNKLNIKDESIGLQDITGLDRDALQAELAIQNEALFSGDITRIEAMLLDQSHTLQALFTHFLQRISGCEYLQQVETYTRLSLKAQNQCRQTLATLGELKNPKRATFIKQQNNAVNQQINQDKNSKKPEKEANEVLEVIPNERLDTRETQATIGNDSEMETVG